MTMKTVMTWMMEDRICLVISTGLQLRQFLHLAGYLYSEEVRQYFALGLQAEG
jgi:hypothetical protein